MVPKIPVSVSPAALRAMIESMRLTVPSASHEAYAETWGGVLFCLDCVSKWAARYGSYDDRVTLQQMHALLLYGQWEACPLDLEPHPKLLGFCLLPAVLPAWHGEWEKMLGWAAEHCAGKWTKCRKLLSVLAWHLSMRRVCRKEMFRCIRCGKLVRQAQAALRSAARQLPGRHAVVAERSFGDDCGLNAHDCA